MSDGLGHLDPTFAANWSGMAAHGLVRGVYQFFRPSENAVAQADLLIAHIGRIGPGDMPPMCDVEVTDGVSNGFLHSQIATWCARVHTRLGVKPLVYTSPGFWNGHGLGSVDANLVVAHWFVAAPAVPGGFSDWTFWQYNDNSRVPGIAGAVDGDEFHGTLADLKAYVGGSHTPPPGGSTGGGTPGTYTVRSGDTMSGIAAKFGISLAALEAANPQVRNPNLIYVGEVLNLPGHSASPPPPPPAPHRTYVVRSGDSMSGIAAKFGVSLAALERANPQVRNPNLIYPGQVLNIP